MNSSLGMNYKIGGGYESITEGVGGDLLVVFGIVLIVVIGFVSFFVMMFTTELKHFWKPFLTAILLGTVCFVASPIPAKSSNVSALKNNITTKYASLGVEKDAVGDIFDEYVAAGGENLELETERGVYHLIANGEPVPTLVVPEGSDVPPLELR